MELFLHGIHKIFNLSNYLLMGFKIFLNRSDSVDDGSVVTPSQNSSYLRKRVAEFGSQEVHHDLPGKRDRMSSVVGANKLLCYPKTPSRHLNKPIRVSGVQVLRKGLRNCWIENLLLFFR